MRGLSLSKRAMLFAVAAGALAFILVLLVTARGAWDGENAVRALIPAIICAVFCWAAAEYTLAATAGAIDAAIERLAQAANGDLEGAVPMAVEKEVPLLASAMHGLFGQLHGNLENVRQLAMFDPVTGLANRTQFRRSCEHALRVTPDGVEAALLFIDLDRFKQVNDTLGHGVGDMLLAMVGNRLRAVAERRGDVEAAVIGRLAGDEFTMFLPDIADRDEAIRVGRNILFALDEVFDVVDREISIGASVGVAIWPDHGRSFGDLMRAADAAMYRAKDGGRGRVECFSAGLAKRIADRGRLEHELREAIARKQFDLAFQPQVSARDGRMVAAEALVRWNHPDGVRMPASFLRRAEESGLIVNVGQWVIEEVAQTIVRWAEMGVEQRLAINVSQRQLDHASFFRNLRAAMHAARASARLLELEISETLAMRCGEEMIAAMAALRDDGATIAIDDFGTGYSNLAQFRRLPVDRVKLDRSLIEPVVESAQARTIVQAIINLVHGLQCEVVAEGVETREQGEVLAVIGCDVLQGYAIGAPMAEDAFLAWARDQRDRTMLSA